MRLLRRLVAYLLFWLGLPVLLGHPKLRLGFQRRLGLHPPGWPQLEPGPRIWLHGASAGDVLALKPLARELVLLRPDARLVATTITNSGQAMAAKLDGTFAAVTFAPWDVPGPVARTLRRVDPKVLVLEYTELWPELIDSAHRRGVRLVLHNGRFSAERLNGYRWLFAVTGNLLRCFDLLLMRDEYEAERARRLGAPPERVFVTGNTKFDNLVVEVSEERRQELAQALAVPPGCRLWVAGSTHEGEEELLLDTYVRLRRRFPDLHLCIAPRYVERAGKVVGLANRRGLRARLRTAAPAPAEVVVVDTIGELVACYSLADLVFVGGSFVTRGGQNILEPAACARPVLFGPHMENFTDGVQVLLGRGGLQVASPEQLGRVLEDLLGRESYRRELGEMARAQVTTVRGAARRNAELVAGLLEAPAREAAKRV
jgi:3-deoxy-D-manno-octulosonic-acid transferase